MKNLYSEDIFLMGVQTILVGVNSTSRLAGLKDMVLENGITYKDLLENSDAEKIYRSDIGTIINFA